jgi:phosphoglucomutase
LSIRISLQYNRGLNTIYSAISRLNTNEVNNKLFDVIEYIDKEILKGNHLIDVTENYIQDLKHLINFELLQSIKEIYSKTNFNNVEFQLSGNSIFRKVETTVNSRSSPSSLPILKGLTLCHETY